MAPAGSNVRAVAAEVIEAVLADGQSLDAAIGKNEQRVVPADRALLRMLCFGCLRNHWKLQSWIQQLLSKPLRKRDRVINSLLAVGLYQLEETRIPDHAVVSATVEAARQLRRPKLAGLVNACLRRFQRDDIASMETSDDAVRWNHPAWLIDRIKKDWPEDWSEILSANNERAAMCLRANPSRSSAEQYVHRLRELGIESGMIDGVSDAVCLAAPQAVETLPGFSTGDVSVQDAAAQIAARWLLGSCLNDSSNHRRRRVLDACAAPGGKSGHLLEIGGDDISLVSIDIDESRTTAIRENLERIGRNATIIAADASKPEQWWDGEAFDAILLDAPCSATGVIRRHPDIKLLRRESDIGRLANLQQGLLESLWGQLAAGGVLLYATCSVIAAENDEVVARFLGDHEDAEENDLLPNNNIRDLMRRKAYGYQILPGTAGLDGFYYASIYKKKDS